MLMQIKCMPYHVVSHIGWILWEYGDDLKKNFKSLLVSYPQVDPAAMGFPKDWDSEPLWRLVIFKKNKKVC